jgi:hypothetical protein
MSTPILVAFVGFLGAIFGAITQALIARANRKQERRLGLESGQTELRLTAYKDLVRFVLAREVSFGRGVRGIPPHLMTVATSSVSNSPAHGRCYQNRLDLTDAANLIVASSRIMNSLVWAWESSQSNDLLIVVGAEVARSSVETGAGDFDEEDIRLLKRLKSLSEERTAEQANRIIDRVQAELIGQSRRRRHSKWRGSLGRRRAHRNRIKRNEFIEQSIDRIEPKFQRVFDHE